jgi:hypothetical protein
MPFIAATAARANNHRVKIFIRGEKERTLCLKLLEFAISSDKEGAFC